MLPANRFFLAASRPINISLSRARDRKILNLPRSHTRCRICWSCLLLTVYLVTSRILCRGHWCNETSRQNRWEMQCSVCQKNLRRIWYYPNIIEKSHRNGKPGVTRGRKATGPQNSGQPGCRRGAGQLVKVPSLAIETVFFWG